MAEQKITKVKLNNGEVYSFFDTGAIHYDAGRLVVGNALIDNLIIRQGLRIVELDDVDAIEFVNSNVVIEKDGIIKKHSADNLLEDIGGCSYSLDNDGTLTLKLGKQEESEGE